ncbi:hypothetical protein ACQZ61_13145 [Agrobacterium vitis]|nr:hypothetical protein [Agrobacterium vitis]
MLAVVLSIAIVSAFVLEALVAWFDEHEDDCFAFLASQMNAR